MESIHKVLHNPVPNSHGPLSCLSSPPSHGGQCQAFVSVRMPRLRTPLSPPALMARRSLFPALASLKPNPFGVTRASPSELPISVPRDLFFPLFCDGSGSTEAGDASCPVFKVKDILFVGFTGRHSRDCCVCLPCCHFVLQRAVATVSRGANDRIIHSCLPLLLSPLL